MALTRWKNALLPVENSFIDNANRDKSLSIVGEGLRRGLSRLYCISKNCSTNVLPFRYWFFEESITPVQYFYGIQTIEELEYIASGARP